MDNFKIIQQNNILNSFFKGRKVPIGTISRGYKKVAEGKWVVFHEDGDKHSEHLDKKTAIDTKNDENRSERSLTGNRSAFKVLRESEFNELTKIRNSSPYKKAEKINSAKNDKEYDFLWQFLCQGSDDSKKIHAALDLLNKK